MRFCERELELRPRYLLGTRGSYRVVMGELQGGRQRGTKSAYQLFSPGDWNEEIWSWCLRTMLEMRKWTDVMLEGSDLVPFFDSVLLLFLNGKKRGEFEEEICSNGFQLTEEGIPSSIYISFIISSSFPSSRTRLLRITETQSTQISGSRAPSSPLSTHTKLSYKTVPSIEMPVIISITHLSSDS